MFNKVCSKEEMPLVLNVPELAQVLRVGINTAYRLVREGVIPSVKVGRQYRVSRDALKAYLEKYV